MSEKLSPTPTELDKAREMGSNTAEKLMNRVEELLDRGDGHFFDPEDHAEALSMLNTARLLATGNHEMIREIDQLLADINSRHR